VILGVCRGIADRFDLSVFWVRVVALGVFVMSGFWPVGVLYILAALVMKPAPAIRPETEEEREFYESYVESPNVAARSLKKRYSDLERRLQRMEDVVTDRDFEWRRHMDG
jgi:phage shock protein C